MNEGKNKFHINWVDVVIIVVVLAVAGAAVLIRNIMTGSASDAKKYTMSFVAEAQDVTQQTIDCVKVGDTIYNSTDNTLIGKVVALEQKAHPVYQFDDTLGEYIICEIPNSYDLYLTIEGEGNVDEKRINIGAYQPAIGKTAYLKSKGYALVSYVVGIDTKNAPIPEDTYTGNGNLEITYQIKVMDIREMSVKAYKVGERLYDKSSKALFGVIENVEVIPHVDYGLVDHEMRSIEKSGRYDIIITLKAHASEREYGYFLDDGIELKVGSLSGVDSSQGIYIDSRFVNASLRFYSILDIK